MVELTNLDDPSATTVNDIKLTEVLSSTDALINGYLGAYVLPITDATALAVLNQPAADIARYKLECRGEIREDVRKRYEDAIAYLKMVAEGRIALPGASLNDGNVAAAATVGTISSDRLFTKSTLSGYTDAQYY